MAVRQHQRVGAELADFGPDLRQLLGFSDAGILQAVYGDGGERRLRAVLPDCVDGIAFDGDQLGAGLGAGGGQALGCRKVCSHGSNPRRSPAFRCADTQLSGGGSIRDSTAGLGIDLLGGLKRVAAVDEQCGLTDQHHREARRARETGQRASRSSDGGTYSFCC